MLPPDKFEMRSICSLRYWAHSMYVSVKLKGDLLLTAKFGALIFGPTTI